MKGLLVAQGAKVSKASGELKKIAKSGFVEKDGCYFLRELIKPVVNISDNDFPDKTGCECFFNSLHVVDYMPGADVSVCLNFVEICFESWRSNYHGDLVSIISLSEGNDFVIKFHLSRPNESWLSDDLNEYDEAILLIKADCHGF